MDSNETALVAAAAQSLAASDNDAAEEQISRLLEEEGLGPREILRQIKDLLRADPSRLIDVDDNGNWKLKRKMLPKHALGIVEITPTKIKMVDKGQLIKLAVEVGRLLPKKSEASQTANLNRPVFIQLPPQMSRDEAFKDAIEVDAIEVKE